MACMAAVTVAALPCSTSSVVSRGSSSSSSTSGAVAASSAPLVLNRSFNRLAVGTPSSSNARRSGSKRFEPLVVKATSSEEASADPNKQFDELISEAKAKWEGVENKSSVAVYAGGALVALWLSSTIIGAVNAVPLLPKLLELVGLGYTGWFVYRYLLFKSSRKELVSDIEELKGKITGATKDLTGKDEISPPSV